MPTGYTAGIIDGTTTTFQDFVKQCMRAFGACLHMRDERMDKEYTPREPSTYYHIEMAKANKRYLEIGLISDAALVKTHKKQLLKSKKEYLESIEKIKTTRTRLESFLKQSRDFKPPTPDHEQLKTFMVDQITKTIDFDCNEEYYRKQLAEIESQLKNISATELRKSLVDSCIKDIAYYKQQYEDEVKRCNESNQWVESLLKALD
jgi:hypothetical protein